MTRLIGVLLPPEAPINWPQKTGAVATVHIRAVVSISLCLKQSRYQKNMAQQSRSASPHGKQKPEEAGASAMVVMQYSRLGPLCTHLGPWTNYRACTHIGPIRDQCNRPRGWILSKLYFSLNSWKQLHLWEKGKLLRQIKNLHCLGWDGVSQLCWCSELP